MTTQATTQARFTGLWRHPEFMKLWTGQAISLFGSQITPLALPLTAILVLGATPAQMGLLQAAQFAPFLLIGLFAGVWVDRLRRRPILLGADLGRAVLLGSIPVAALLGLLRLEQLYVVGFLVGICTVFFDVAYQSFLPSLVGRKQLVEGNSKLEMSRSVMQLTGPGLAGLLVQLVTAPLAIVVDALSFLASMLSLSMIRTSEAVPAPHAERRNIWAEIGEGLHRVLGDRFLRPIAACTGSLNLCNGMINAVYALYLIRELGIQPAALGIIVALGSAGAFLGTLLAERAARQFGLGPAIVGTVLLSGSAHLLIPLAGTLLLLTVPLLVVSRALFGFGNTIFTINQLSLRQAITPDRFQGRVNASMRFLAWGTLPIGSLLGGALGGTIGLGATLLIAAVGNLLSCLWMLFSPVYSLHEQPAPVQEPAPVTA